MAFPNVSDLITTTLEHRSTEIADNVSQNNAILAQLKKSGRIKTVSGGRLIYEPLSFQENSNGGWYSGYDTLPVAAQDVITSAEYPWKQYAVPVTISGLEQMQNSGKEALFDLLEERINVAEATMANDISQGLYSDGSAAGGKQLTGLAAAVPVDPTTGVYGGINSNLWPFWQSYALDTGAAPAANTIQGHFNTAWANLVRGADTPNLILVDGTVWQAFTASLQLIQRITDPDTAKLGFPSLKYMTADVVLDGGIGGYADLNTAYFLNTKYLKFRPHSERNFVPLDPRTRTAINQDAAVSILGFMGNLTVSGRRFQGRVTFNA